MDSKKQKQTKKKQYAQQNLALKSQIDNPKIVQKLQKKQIFSRKQLPEHKKVSLFTHLPQYESSAQISQFAFKNDKRIHRSIIKFCLKRSKELWKESSSHVIDFLNAIKDFLRDFKPTEEKSTGIKTELETRLNMLIQFMSDSIGITIGTGSAIKALKKALAGFLVHEKLSPAEAKKKLIAFIETFISEKIRIPKEKIIQCVADAVQGRSTILTFSTSYKIVEIISKAKPKKVFVVSNYDVTEGSGDLEEFAETGVECVVVGINAVANYIKKVDIVLLNALAVFSNGTVLSERGSSSIGMLAHEYDVPLIVTCEAFKFTERVQLDPIVFNEIDSANELIERYKNQNYVDELKGWEEIRALKLLNLRYDIIPVKFVSQIASEFGLSQPSSAGVLIGEF